jgi:ubiquinone/menaquinone biosynthesis C-methylase UbiE
MESTNQNEIKQTVHDYWNDRTCGTWVSHEEKYTKEYYEDIEKDRYLTQPEIFSFAQFTRFHGKKLLEVGVGAGTDFLQWVRAGTQAYGIDLTPEAIEHVNHRLSIYGLKAEEIKVGDSEAIPYPDNFFDVVYIWGVIHHTPNTEKAMQEIIRVCKPGGTCKIMIYHRHSLLAWFFWMKRALLKGKIWRSVSWVLWHHMESYGTKAYTTKEVSEMLGSQPVENVRIQPVLSYYDKLGRFNKFLGFVSKFAAWIMGGDNVGWFLTIEFNKK